MYVVSSGIPRRRVAMARWNRIVFRRGENEEIKGVVCRRGEDSERDEK
jgi:hypothetical protein